MKIGIDARMYGYSGIGSYLRGLLDNLPDEGKEAITLFGNPVALNAYRYPVISSHVPIYGIKEQIYLPGLYKKHPVDLLHVPHYNIPCRYKGTLVVTIHDLNHLLFPQFLPNRLALVYAKYMFKTAIKKAAIVIADSFNTKNDIHKHFDVKDEKVRVVYLGVDKIFSKELTKDQIESIRFHYSLPKKYILYVGNLRKSKNISFLIQAFRALKKKLKNEYSLVLVGKNFMHKTYWEINKMDNVIVKEDVSWHDLPGIYKGAKMFVFPSLYEGFGLPPLEAMACGVPVICSTAGSLPEIMGDAAIKIHPADCAGLADSMEKLLTDVSLCQDMIQKGKARAERYKWEDTALKTWNIYQEAIQN